MMEAKKDVEQRAEIQKKSMIDRLGRSLSFSLRAPKEKPRGKSRIEQVYKRGTLPSDAHWLILNPRDEFLKRWDIYVMILLLFTAVVTPFEVAFLETDVNFLFVLNRIIDLSFVIDMYINFVTARFVEDTGKWRYKLGQIAKSYLMGWFTIDLISILPFDVAGVLMDNDEVSQLKVFRVVRLFRLLKLARIFRASRIFARWENSISLSYSWMSLIKFMVGVATVAHWMACVWRLVVDVDAVEYDANGDLQNWLIGYGADEMGEWEQFFTALYWSVMTITTIGYGDVTPKTNGERVLATLCMLLGASIYAYVVGAVCGIVSGLDEATSKFHNTMDNLNRYMEEYKIPQPLRMTLREYFRHCRGLARQKNYHHLLLEMSPTLRGQVAVFCYSAWILKVPFFNSPLVADEEREAFTVEVALRIQPKAFAPNESIIRVHQLAREMYILQKGVVAKHGRIINSGQFFGEDMILKDYNRLYAVRSLTYADVFELTKADLTAILATGAFPGTKAAIRKAAIALAFRVKFAGMSKSLSLFNFPKARRRSIARAAKMGLPGSVPGIGDSKEVPASGEPTPGGLRLLAETAEDDAGRERSGSSRRLLSSGADGAAASGTVPPNTPGGSVSAASTAAAHDAAAFERLIATISAKHSALANSTTAQFTRLSTKIDALSAQVAALAATQAQNSKSGCVIC